MRTVLLAVFLGLAASRGILAQDVAEPPDSVPLWVVIVAGEDGRIVMSFPDDEASKSENYTVNVPYQENGQVKFRVETRVRERKVGVTRKPKIMRWRPNDVQFLDLNGNQLENFDVANRIVKPTRMMAVTAPKIDPYFQAILKPETLVVVIPAKNLAGR